MQEQSKLQKFITFCDRAMVFSFCALIYFLPISIALNETFTGLALFFYLLKRGGQQAIFLKEKKSLGEEVSLGQRVGLFFKLFKPIDNPLNRPIALLLGVSLISVIFSQYPGVSFKGFLGKMLQAAFIYFNFIECMNSRKRLRIFFTVFFVSCVLICTNGLFQHFTGKGFIHGHIHDGRMASSFRHANDLAAYLVIIVPVLFCLTGLLGRKPKEKSEEGFVFLYKPVTRILVGILFIVTIICFALTYCRGAWIGFFLGTLFLGLKNRKIFIGFAVLISIFFLCFFQGLIKERGGDMVLKNMNDVLGRNNRLGFWQRAGAIIKDYPVFGSGVNTYSLVQQNYTVGWGGYPHNSYIQMMAETGIVGIGAFLWMLIVLFAKAFQSLKKTGPPIAQSRSSVAQIIGGTHQKIEAQHRETFVLCCSSKMVLFGFLTGFLCFLIHSFFDTNFYSVQISSLMWLMMGVIVAVQKVEFKENSALKIQWLQKPNILDASLLTLFTILITAHPYYLHSELNLFELGIYLPGIQAILNGLIPFRDFFLLRGPLELYVPAFFMHLFGENATILSTYFYVGTVFTLILYVFIAKELYKTRFVLYLMIPVFIGRTFPRVAFTFWGGMRYGLGALALLFIIYFFKRKKSFWIFLAGLVSSLALLTSIEVGVCAIFSAAATFIFALIFSFLDRKFLFKSVLLYTLGILSVLIPYGSYLFFTQSLIPYFDMTYNVITNMTRVFPEHFLDTNLPANMWGYFVGLNPFNQYFKVLTPTYCYLFFIGYLIFRIKKRTFKASDLAIFSVFAYGIMMYFAAFRKIGACQFEMTLQPEKILLFIMLEEFFLFLWQKRSGVGISFWKKFGIWFLILGFVGSSVGYSIARFNHRFVVVKYVHHFLFKQDMKALRPLAQRSAAKVGVATLSGMVVPSSQAEDFQQLNEFARHNMDSGKPVFMFPELGSYSFIVDRPFVGRFPMATFSWIGGWQEELFLDLKRVNPKYAVLSKDPGPSFEKAYFKVKPNKISYDKIMRYINENYVQVGSTPSLLIYQRKDVKTSIRN